MASLWPVDDSSTGLLMTKFYERLKAGDGKAEALRKGQELAARTRRSVGTRIPSQDKNRNISLQKSAEEYEELWDEEQDGGAEECLAGGHVLTDAGSVGRAFGVDGRIESEGNSESTARDLATLCRDHYGSDYALSVADCPDYDPDDPEAEAPTTWVACAGPDGVKTKSLTLLGDVSFTRSRSAKTALDLLRGMLPAEN